MRDYFSQIITVLVAVAGSGAITGLFIVRPQRRKINADTDITLSDTAMTRMKKAEDKADAAESRVDRLESDMQKMRRKFFAYELWADQHQSWDQEAVAEVESLGGHLRPPPQLVIIKGI